MSVYTRELALSAADNLQRSLERHTGELPEDKHERYMEWIGRAAAFEAAVEYAIDMLRRIAAEADVVPGFDDLGGDAA